MEYKIGQYIKLKPPIHANDDIFCVCEMDPETSPPAGFRGCWHGPKTVILRIFQDGGLLLKNGDGYVRVAQPDEVSDPPNVPGNQRRRDRKNARRR
jgi:hypothetical protein